MIVSKALLTDLQRGNLYYMSVMHTEAATFLESRAASEVFSKAFGEGIVDTYFKRHHTPEVTLVDFVRWCDSINDRLINEDADGDPTKLFHLLEDLNFYVGEISITYTHGITLCEKLGLSNEAAITMLNEIGADLLGFKAE